MPDLPDPTQAPPDVRVSTREREEMVARLQHAFTEGMLDEPEFGSRVKSALTARTRSDLYPLAEDLPMDVNRAPVPSRVRSELKRQRLTAYGSDLIRKGRWTVPATAVPVIFKGHAVLDLRHAILTSNETRISIRAYKSTVEIIVPPGVSVDARGVAYKGGWTDEAGEDGRRDAARVVTVRGLAYKSHVVIRRMREDE